MYFVCERFKAEKGWYNFNISRPLIHDLLKEQSWYDLYIPSEELEISSFARVYQWQEIAEALLKKYMEWFFDGQILMCPVCFLEGA